MIAVPAQESGSADAIRTFVEGFGAVVEAQRR
jgi:hypothetical protein